jgi:hypothetical protein
MVRIEPRGTRRVCGGCRRLVTPPGVLAPYQRGPDAARAARSQRERDDDAKRTAMLAGEFLRRVTALRDDPKIHPRSADLLGWYQEEITDARRASDAGRLAELAAEFEVDQADRAFRRLRWWQGEPAPVAAGHLADDDDEWEDDDGQGDEAAAPAAIAARATWAEAFAARGWRLTPWDGQEACQVAGDAGRCRQPAGGHPPVTDGLTPDGWTCTGHYEALNATCQAINRDRGFT